MNCPNCHAKLLPVKGELFCLQCGQAIDQPKGLSAADLEPPRPSEATEPLLRRAINDVMPRSITFDEPAASVVNQSDQLANPVRARDMVVAPAARAHPDGKALSVEMDTRAPYRPRRQRAAPARVGSQAVSSSQLHNQPQALHRVERRVTPKGSSAVTKQLSDVSGRPRRAGMMSHASGALGPSAGAHPKGPSSAVPALAPRRRNRDVKGPEVAANRPLADGLQPAAIARGGLVGSEFVAARGEVTARPPTARLGSQRLPNSTLAPPTQPGMAASSPKASTPAISPNASASSPHRPGAELPAATAAGALARAFNKLPARSSWGRWWKALLRVKVPLWAMIVLAALALVVSANALVSWYYHDRVYPGVTVAGQNLGGTKLAAVEPVLRERLPEAPVRVTIGSVSYALTVADLGARLNLAEIAAAVRDRGRHHSIALIGVFQTMTSAPIEVVEYRTDQHQLEQLVWRLTDTANHPAVDAHPLIVGAAALVISEKAGAQVDYAKVRDGLLTALKNGQRVVVAATKLTPAITTASFARDIDDAQAKIGLSLSVKVKTQSYTATPAQVAGWLSFGEPGSGAKVEPSRVAAYLNGLPGAFDRAAAQAALIAAIQHRQPLDFSAPTTRRAVLLTDANVAPLAPKSYSYCVATRGNVAPSDQAQFATRAATALVAPSGWSLGGQLAFTAAPRDCNFTLWLAEARAMGELSSACAGHTTCRVGNDVAVSIEAWRWQPANWAAGLEDYRGELVNHEVGHWLGFDHTSCATSARPSTPVNQITVHVGGCSPDWYALPAETQNAKVLSGF